MGFWIWYFFFKRNRRLQKLDDNTFSHMMALISEVFASYGYVPRPREGDKYMFERKRPGGMRHRASVSFLSWEDHDEILVTAPVGITRHIWEVLVPYYTHETLSQGPTSDTKGTKWRSRPYLDTSFRVLLSWSSWGTCALGLGVAIFFSLVWGIAILVSGLGGLVVVYVLDRSR